MKLGSGLEITESLFQVLTLSSLNDKLGGGMPQARVSDLFVDHNRRGVIRTDGCI